MSKKGQVAVFFIVGAIILITFGLVTILGESNVRKPFLEQSISLESINEYVESCLKDTVEDAIYFVSSQGGYYQPHSSQVFKDLNVAVYLKSEQFSVPDLFTIEQEFDHYIESHLDHCIDNFNGLTSLGYQIEQSAINTETRVGENEITTFATYPLTITTGSTKREMERFSVSIPFDFKDVYKTIQSLMIQQGEDLQAVHFGYLAESAYNNGYFFEINHLDNNIVVYSLQFENIGIDEKPFSYNFAVQYGWGEAE